MTQDELKMVLEALELCNGAETVEGVVIYTDKAITAIEEALAQPEQKPVIDKSAAIRIATVLGWEPKRKPLTDEEMADFLGDRYHIMTEDELEFFRLGEAAHDIKENT